MKELASDWPDLVFIILLIIIIIITLITAITIVVNTIFSKQRFGDFIRIHFRRS